MLNLIPVEIDKGEHMHQSCFPTALAVHWGVTPAEAAEHIRQTLGLSSKIFHLLQPTAAMCHRAISKLVPSAERVNMTLTSDEMLWREIEEGGTWIVCHHFARTPHVAFVKDGKYFDAYEACIDTDRTDRIFWAYQIPDGSWL